MSSFRRGDDPGNPYFVISVACQTMFSNIIPQWATVVKNALPLMLLYPLDRLKVDWIYPWPIINCHRKTKLASFVRSSYKLSYKCSSIIFAHTPTISSQCKAFTFKLTVLSAKFAFKQKILLAIKAKASLKRKKKYQLKHKLIPLSNRNSNSKCWLRKESNKS